MLSNGSMLKNKLKGGPKMILKYFSIDVKGNDRKPR